MITKAFEIRDRATFIPVLATLMVPDGNRLGVEGYLLRRAGFSMAQTSVILCRMEASGTSNNATYDPYSWRSRTMTVAHDYIEKNFTKLISGEVVDVEFILGETKEPKTSERYDHTHTANPD